MAISTQIKSTVNSWLSSFNLRLETLTKEKTETCRLKSLEQSGYFEEEAFPIPRTFRSAKIDPIVEELSKYSQRFDDFKDATHNSVGYTFENPWYSSPDAEILYTMIRKFRPNKIIEVGCGNSTKIMRQAIIDKRLKTRLIAIDPQSRVEIKNIADEIHLKPIESFGVEFFHSLTAGDMLFLDSSHEVKTGNDITFLYLNVIPSLKTGVLIHIHDIFLPYDYPKDWIMGKGRGWGEQYLVQALLIFSTAFEVLWPAYYLQRTMDDFKDYFPHLKGRAAKSLWLRKIS